MCHWARYDSLPLACIGSTMSAKPHFAPLAGSIALSDVFPLAVPVLDVRCQISDVRIAHRKRVRSFGFVLSLGGALNPHDFLWQSRR